MWLPERPKQVKQAKRGKHRTHQTEAAQRERRHRGPARGSLMRRAQQWLAAREQLVSAWITRTRSRARASMQAHVLVRRRARDTAGVRLRLGGAGAIVLPFWWEYESPLKRRLALEAMLRRIFAVVPESSATT